MKTQNLLIGIGAIIGLGYLGYRLLPEGAVAALGGIPESGGIPEEGGGDSDIPSERAANRPGTPANPLTPVYEDEGGFVKKPWGKEEPYMGGVISGSEYGRMVDELTGRMGELGVKQVGGRIATVGIEEMQRRVEIEAGLRPGETYPVTGPGYPEGAVKGYGAYEPGQTSPVSKPPLKAEKSWEIGLGVW